ncbi:Uncharacterised protein [Mycobacteroides abscessus subsp. massiliense]|nr:Uncharacterised protein [Mycobacteroides abscessus subsp. abscessus]SKK82954.1 Uncharacterised protein [Mycobacteroides abscessus subsp. massiliense]SHO94850.1 Uncharacterised protein [Mycobacteroides abscessus subsp. abscessus]SHP32479.1 Uncharacterised protein [Mycobacteroides abscessus subsp. abscessus]SHP55914.1 Uncharacterised protein [Mycobacteroides abscessus subsp. abscessus]
MVPPERTVGRPFRVHVNPLMIASGVGEGVHALLVNQ